MLSVTSHQRDANWNHNEIPPHTGQNGHHKQSNKQQVLERMWREGNPSALLVGLHTGATTMENSMEFPQKTKNGSAFWPRNSTARIISWEPWNTNPRESMHPNVNSSTIYNNQVLEATEMPISKLIYQKTMVHLRNGILCSKKKEGTPTLCKSMDGIGKLSLLC